VVKLAALSNAGGLSRKEKLCDHYHSALAQSALFLDHGNSGTPYGIEGQAMRRILSVTVVAALLIVTAVNVIAAGVKMNARNHYAAPVAGISVALPSGMKSFPVELPE
jgi:hypothetical protein